MVAEFLISFIHCWILTTNVKASFDGRSEVGRKFNLFSTLVLAGVPRRRPRTSRKAHKRREFIYCQTTKFSNYYFKNRFIVMLVVFRMHCLNACLICGAIFSLRTLTLLRDCFSCWELQGEGSSGWWDMSGSTVLFLVLIRSGERCF